MDAMAKFAFERMDQQLTTMAEKIKELEYRCQQLEKLKPQSNVPNVPVNDELINVKVAKTILDVSRNTFLTMVSKGIFTPIRMNLRTIRYSRLEIQRFIDQRSGMITEV